jgi:LytS/YehU family sensor histidine kinase
MQLSAMLRTVLAGVRAATWPLADELALVDTLFALHRLRDPDRFQLRRRVPSPLPPVEVPPMLLLPLAENAIKHGPSAGHVGAIELEVGTADDGRLRIALRNPGPYRGPRPAGNGLAIVERRLALAYDGRAMLRIARDGEATVAEVTLPATGVPGATT